MKTVDKKVPGPGNYPTYCSINGNGIYCLSKYRSIHCRGFGGQVKSELKKHFNIPGPGAYQVPSEFGIYKAQPKYIKESERVDRIRSASIEMRATLKSKISGDSYEGNTNTSDLAKKTISIDYKQ